MMSGSEMHDEGEASPQYLSAGAEFARGWLVLSATFVGIGCGISSLSFYTTGVFMVPLQEEFGWSRSAISGTGIFGVAMLALLSPGIGAVIDKLGIRLVASASLVAYSIGLFANSFLFSSLFFYYGLAIATAFVAAGSSPVTFTRAVTGWFDTARGLALGLALLGAGAASVLAPLLLTQAVESFGWRNAYRLLALVVFLSAIYVLLFLKSDPPIRLFGQDQAVTNPPSNTGLNAKEAYYTLVFWQMAGVFLLVSLAVSGLIVHFIPLLTDIGMSATEAGRLAAVIGISIMVGRIGVGVLIDRIFAPYVAVALFGLATTGYIAFLLGGPALALAAAIAIGLSMGAEVDLIGYMVSRYFGLKSYGVLYGSLYSVFLLGAGLSPFLAGLVFDFSGSYQLFLIGAICCLGTAALICLTFKSFPDFNEPTV